jgi:hypothetical protein
MSPFLARVSRSLLPHSLVLMMLLLAAGCGGAFHSAGSGVTNPSAGPPEVQFTLGDGKQTGRVDSGDVLTLLVSAAPARFSGVVDKKGLPDPSRFSLTMSADLGDPAQGGVAAGDNLVPFLLASGFVTPDAPGGTVDVSFNIDTGAPIPFPEGQVNFALSLQAEVGSPGTGAVTVEILASNRPTLSFTCEQPSPTTTPTGKPLPLSQAGNFLVGHTLPFAVIFRATPNPQTNASFKFRRNGVGNPDAISWTADQDLGDPDHGGFHAGDNLAPLVTTNVDVSVDKDGVVTTGFRFDQGSALLPLPGVLTMHATVTDVDGASSLEQTIRLEVEDEVSLRIDVMPIIDPLCTQCHGPAFHIYSDLDLSLSGIITTAVGKRAGETPDDSCATLRLAPYDADASYLIHKVLGTMLGGCVNGSGQQMPAGFPPLGDDQVQVLTNWILQGCFDN